MDALTQAAHIAQRNMLEHALNQYLATAGMEQRVIDAFAKVYAELHAKRPGCVVEEMERERGLR